jgi:hypothetical protein
MAPLPPEVPRRVEPQLLFGVSLIGGLALSWRALSGAMHGDVDITVAGVRLLVSIAFVWVCSYGITALLTSYSVAADRRARDTAASTDASDGPRRRAADEPAVPEAGEIVTPQ